MIIECEKCASKFNFDETLLKPEGSKLKCSQCQHVFIAYPPEDIPTEGPTSDMAVNEDFEETLPLDSVDPDFDMAFEKAVEESGTEEAISEDPIAEEEEVGQELDLDVDADVAPVIPKKKAKVSRGLILLLSAIVLIGVGAAVVYYLFPASSEKQESTDPGVMRLDVSRAVTGSFIQSEKGEQLFVIKGIVINNYPAPRSYILIKGEIEDDTGKIVKSAVSYAGNTFSDDQIKKKSMEELKKVQMNRVGEDNSNVSLKTGGSIPFMIVFDKLPENISEFTVEAVSSTPGK